MSRVRECQSPVAIGIAAVILLSACGAGAVPNNDSAQPQGSPIALRMQTAIELCKKSLSSPTLDLIRSKADPLRVAADGEPPLALTSNDAFPSESDHLVIAEWMNLRDLCVARFDALGADLPSPNGISDIVLQQLLMLSKLSSASVGDLILALYQGKMTYGEFARKRYEFTRDSAAINAAFNQAALDQDQRQLVQAQQQMSRAAAAWETYINELRLREPRKGAVDLKN